MSENTVNNSEVVIVKEPWYKKLWNHPLTRRIVKGGLAVGACIGSGVIGYKAGLKHNVSGTEMEIEPEDDAE